MLNFDLHGQRAKVALLAVDKAFYALNTDNKLTAKQVELSQTPCTHTLALIKAHRFDFTIQSLFDNRENTSSCSFFSGLFLYAVI